LTIGYYNAIMVPINNLPIQVGQGASMAGNPININLNVTDNGDTLKKRNQEAKELGQHLTRAAQLSEKALRPAAQKQPGEGTEYGRARGSMGTTGASARDFANQAQGLGGLVRLYATVAANLFAVGAAFNALREAMNTSNMIEGLNQLGAQSGQSLGILAKNLAAASGGAISLREAMEATVKATSSGMSSKQLMELGKVARNASQALGLTMSDAISRLTRGITKLEPELLDELGLFTKLDMATQQYALSVGKSTAALTDLERRQAFANAVLKEGIDKFGGIDIPTNPYDKLLSSLKNLAQNGLEAANKYLGPLINALSQSPSALTAAIAAVGVTLVKQALPAIGEYREGLKSSADAAAELAGRKAAAALQAQAAVAEKVRLAAEANAEAEVAAVDKAAKRIEQIRGTSFGKQSRGYAILQKATQDVTKEELEYLQKVGDRYKKSGKQEIADRYYAAKAAIESSKQAEEAYGKVVEENTKKLKEQSNIFTARGQAEALAKRTAAIAASKGIVSQATQDTGTLGAFGAFKEMMDSITKSDKMGPIRKGFTAIAGSISIATTAITGFVGAIQGFLFAGAAVLALLKGLDAWMTSSEEQTVAFNGALDASNESIKTYERTLALLLKTDPENIFQSKVVMAQANAFKGLVENLTEVREKFEELTKAQNGWDRFVDRLLSVVNKDQLSKFAEGTVKQIAASLAAIDSDAERQAAQSQISNLLGAKGTGQIEWLQAIKEQGPEAAKSIKAVEGVFAGISKQQQLAAARSEEYDESLNKLNKTYKEFVRSTLDTSPATKLGEDMVNASVKLAGALQDPINSIGNMKRLLQESAITGLFSPATVQQINRLKPEIESLNKLHGATTIELKKARQEVAALTLDYEKVQKSYEGTTTGVNAEFGGDMVPSQVANLEQVGEKLNKAQARLLELAKKDTEERKKIASLMAEPVFRELVVEGFEKGSNLVKRDLDAAFEKARIGLARGIIGLIGEVPGVAQLESKLNQADFKLRETQIQVMRELVQAQNLATAATIGLTAATNLSTAQENVKGAYRTPGMQEQAQTALADAEVMKTLTDQFQAVIATGKGSKTFLDNLSAGLRQLKVQSPEALTLLAQMRSAVSADLKLGADKAAIDREKELDSLKTENKVRNEAAKLRAEAIKLQSFATQEELRSIDILQQRNGQLNIEQIARREVLQNQQAQNAFDTTAASLLAEKANFESNINVLKKQYKDLNTKELEDAFKLVQQNKEKANEQQLANSKQQNALAKDLEILKTITLEETRRIQRIQTQTEIRAISNSANLEVAQLELDLQIKRESLTEQQIADAKRSIEYRQLELDTTAKLAAAEINWLTTVNRLREEYLKADPGEAGEATRERIRQDMALAGQRFQTEIDATNKLKGAKKSLIDEEARYSERQKAYGEVFKNTFNGMADAIAEFAKTGKLNFKGLINSMLEDLLRYELRLQAMQMYAAFRPGLMNLVGSIFNPAGGFGSGYGYGQQDLGLFLAKGGAFDGGVQKFGKGGMFTNKIVTEPTLFKFAQGAGLMGEAGPEAIMPLKRDGQGNLGVRTTQQQPKVDVVVNNFSGEKAETMETVDSKGNRKIEVVIGEMVASEVGRKNSPMQQSISANFMTRPAMTRR